MIKENKASKYVLYAIGEIILVVIGILIALQINNWNQHRQQRLSVDQGLLEVRTNLISDSLKMIQRINRMGEEINVQQEIIEVLENGIVLDSSYDKKLGKCMTVGYTPITQNGYNVLKTIGLENINNKNLENQLVNYYEILKKYFEDEVDDDRLELFDVWLPYVRKNFKDYDYRNYAIPKNYQNLSSDTEFLVMLKINLNNRTSTFNQFTNMQKALKALVLEIDERLKKDN